jgi:hypothetical protein
MPVCVATGGKNIFLIKFELKSPPPSDDDDSGSDVSTDEEDDVFHGYEVSVPRAPNLRVWYDPHYNSYRCPVCPSKKASRWLSMEHVQSEAQGG